MDLNPYAQFLGDREPMKVVASTSARLARLCAELSHEQIEARPAPGKWSVREIVAHLADCELVFSFRLRQTLAEDHAVIQPFDQERWAERYAKYDFDSAMRMYAAARRWNLLWLSSITAEERLRPTTHPERGTMTLWTIVETMAGHDLNHVLQIERIALAG